MDRAAFEEHLRNPAYRGAAEEGGHDGIAGGAPCGDVVRFSVRVEGDRVSGVSFDASGCGAMVAAGSAAASLVAEASVVEAARVGPQEIAAELGGLSPGKLHAADLAADALARALGSAVFAGADVPARPDRTLVAMSGGVDSAVAALACRDGGEGDVVAVTLELWRDEEGDAEGSCCSASAVIRARRVARALGIPHFTLDLREDFRREVVDPWIQGHRDGQTPNPCIRCNGGLRLDAMIAFADRLGAARLATGHYARREAGGRLLTGADASKDQSYMLSALSADSVERMHFPLGMLTKDQVRERARKAGLEVASTPDSQDLCFLAGVGRTAFLRRFGQMGEKRGPIVLSDGTVVGEHAGAHRFTVGQRRGLDVGGLPEPVYVLETDVRANVVTVGTRDELVRDEIQLTDLRLSEEPEAVSTVRLRSHAPAVGCRLEGTRIQLEQAVVAPAPGQTAVFLRGDRVVGCATIA